MKNENGRELKGNEDDDEDDDEEDLSNLLFYGVQKYVNILRGFCWKDRDG